MHKRILAPEIEYPGRPGVDPGAGVRSPAGYPLRPGRFPIRTPLHFRKSGELEWHKGTTINISRSGVFFRADHDLEPKTVLEMRIVFPAEITGDAPTKVVCWGPVVRREPPAFVDGRPALAAAIFGYRYCHD